MVSKSFSNFNIITSISTRLSNYSWRRGATGVSNPNVGIQGTPSVFSTITSTGGGGGGKWGCGGQTTGGSGGGSAQPCGTGGSGNTPPTSPPQGNNGGNLGNWQMGGGGGAGCRRFRTIRSWLSGPSSRNGKGGRWKWCNNFNIRKSNILCWRRRWRWFF
jgi:hypothetical protein